MKNIAIILAGGKGNRFKDKNPKQFLYLKDRRIIDYSIKTFSENKEIDDIIIVCHSKWIETINNEYSDLKVIEGGASRKESVFLGLKSCPSTTENVLIHDAARPFVSKKIITESIQLLSKYNAVNVAIRSSDTVAIIKNNIIESIPNRENIFLSQTPQSFKYKIILEAHNKIKDNNFSDDMQLVEKIGIKCYNFEGDIYNIKITHKHDLNIAKIILSDLEKKGYKNNDFR